MSSKLIRTDSRRAGDVIRWSTWPVIRTQTCAHHTWNVMRILVEIWPEVPAEALVAALYHDAGELGSGDIPFPYKAQNKILKKMMDEMEERSLEEQGVHVPPITDVWARRIKICDLVEMLEHGMDEVILGSMAGRIVIRNIEDALESKFRDLSEEEKQAVTNYLVARWGYYRQMEELT